MWRRNIGRKSKIAKCICIMEDEIYATIVIKIFRCICAYVYNNKKFMNIDREIVARVKKKEQSKIWRSMKKYARTFSKEYIWKLFRELSSNDHCHGGQNCICDFGEPSALHDGHWSVVTHAEISHDLLKLTHL